MQKWKDLIGRDDREMNYLYADVPQKNIFDFVKVLMMNRIKRIIKRDAID